MKKLTLQSITQLKQFGTSKMSILNEQLKSIKGGAAHGVDDDCDGQIDEGS